MNKEFRFADETEQRIYQRLSRLVGPGPAAFFLDACKLMANEERLATRTHLIAHLLREVESALRAMLMPQDLAVEDVKGPGDARTKDQGQSTQINCILETLGEDSDSRLAAAWRELAGGSSLSLAGWAHRNRLAPPREFGSEIRKVWNRALTVFDGVLGLFEARFAAGVFSQIDMILRRGPHQVSNKDLSEAIPQTPAALGYLFRKGEVLDPAWLKRIEQVGYFGHPPRLEVGAGEEGATFRPWPASQYLVRVAKVEGAADDVLRIAEQLPDTDNPFVHEDVADVALALPPALAVRLVPRIEGWLLKPAQWMLPLKAADVVVRLAGGGESQWALRLFRVLVSPIDGGAPQAQEVQDDVRSEGARSLKWPRQISEMRTLLDRMLEPIVDAVELEAVRLLADLLELSIEGEDPLLGEPPEDYLGAWYLDGADVERFSWHSARALLILNLRRASQQLFARRHDIRGALIEELLGRRWNVFRGQAISLLATSADPPAKLVEEVLGSRDWFCDDSLWRYFSTLLESQFGRMPRQMRDRMLAWIDSGPPEDPGYLVSRADSDEPPTVEELETYRERWQLRRLHAIAGHLEPIRRAKYEDLKARHGESRAADEYISKDEWTGSESPLGQDQLTTMSVREIVAYLAEWSPSGSWIAPSTEGLAGELAQHVTRRSGEFAAVAEAFLQLNPEYTSALLRGLSAAVSREAFDWPPVLSLLEAIVDDAHGDRSSRNEIAGGSQRAWVIRSAAHLLSTGFSESPGCIPISLRQVVWGLVESMWRLPADLPEVEAGNDAQSMGSLMLALNTTRGAALLAVLAFGAWVRRNEREIPPTAIPEVAGVLVEYLGDRANQSPAMHAVIGRHLNLLANFDMEWLERHLDRILPLGSDKQHLWRAAWNAFVTGSAAHRDTYSILSQHYRRALFEPLTEPARPSDGDPAVSLADHLMTLYGSGVLSLDDGSLLRSFYEAAPPNHRAEAMKFVGGSLRRTEGELSSIIRERLEVLWEWRLTVARSDSAAHEAEMAAFGWWFVSRQFGLEWSLEQLKEAVALAGHADPDIDVYDALLQVADHSPEKVLDVMRRLFAGIGQRYDSALLFGRQGLMILTRLARAEIQAVQAGVRELANRAVAQGLGDFTDLARGKRGGK